MLVYDLIVRFLGGFIAALLSKALLGMDYTIGRALVFAALYAVMGTVLRALARKVGLLHEED